MITNPTWLGSCSSTKSGSGRFGRSGRSWPTTSSRSCACRPGLNPNDPGLVALIGHLPTRSDEFRTRWAANNVRAHRAGIKIFNHSLIGRLALPAETMTINAGADHTITVFTPQPGSPEHDALRLLAGWNADTATATDVE